MQAFRNYRKNMDRQNIREPCRKKICVEPSEKPNIYGLINYQPDMPIGDTEDTLKEAEQNKNKVETLMEKVYYLRRNIILKYGMVKDILQQFPYLCKQEYLSKITFICYTKS